MTDALPPELFTLFEGLPRQGPGDVALTQAMLMRVWPLLPTQPPRTADMGCGSGASSLVLAAAGCRVTAIDVHEPFLEALQRTARARGLALDTRLASMLQSGLEPGSLDLVWSEGAVFTVGFEAAMACFQTLLRPGGVAVVSEAVWQWDPAQAPAEVRAFWAEGYPDLAPVGIRLEQLRAAGWRLIDTRILDPQAWEASFLTALDLRLRQIEAQPGHPLASLVPEHRLEIELLRRHRDVVGYAMIAVQRG